MKVTSAHLIQYWEVFVDDELYNRYEAETWERYLTESFVEPELAEQLEAAFQELRGSDDLPKL